MPWVPSDTHARGRQHVAHLERARQRLADGVLLARVLNRTVVLPQFHCYCDKYWARLTQCTIGTQVLGSQPLPFVCPLDHVIPVSGWYGNWAARKARGRRCALPARADGPPTHGFPYRTHGWLATAARQPHLARVGGTLVPTNASADYGGRGAVVGWRRTHDGVELAAAGEAIPIARGATARALRDRARTDPVLATRPLFRVSLSDARALLRCVDFDARALLEQLFRVHWCWRPEGLRESKDDKTKTDDGQDVCVWGFKVPEAPPLCPR